MPTRQGLHQFCRHGVPLPAGDLGVPSRFWHDGYLEGDKEEKAGLGYGMK